MSSKTAAIISEMDTDPEQRRLEAVRILKKYPDRLPVLCRPASSREPPLDKTKYLVPPDLSIGQFLYIIRKRVIVAPTQALFLYCDTSNPKAPYFPPLSQTVGSIYDQYHDEDGYLCVAFCLEHTFG